MRDIFVSYRRSDASGVTERIVDHLKATFGEAHLFKDLDSIPLGADFRESMNTALQDCDVLLAVIGQKWLDAKDDAGSRRIDNPDDYVRMEIKMALDRNIPVIPVLVEGAAVPKAEDLPEPLRNLAFRNALVVRPDPDFQHDIGRLCGDVSRVLDIPDPRLREESRSRRRWLAAIAAVIVLASLAVLFAKRSNPPIPQPAIPQMTFIHNVTVIVQEYEKYQGKPLDKELQQLIERAVQRAMENKHRESIELLEQIAEKAPLPAIYTNLGVEYAKVNQAEDAKSAFAKAIEKDSAYQAALANQKLLESSQAAAPKATVAISYEPSEMTNILIRPLEPKSSSVNEFQFRVGSRILYSPKQGDPNAATPGKYSLYVDGAEGGSFELAKTVEVKKGQTLQINPNVMLGAIVVEQLVRKDFPAIKKIEIVEAKEGKWIYQSSAKFGVPLLIAPGRYNIHGTTAYGDPCELVRGVEVNAQQEVRLRMDEEVAGFVVRKPKIAGIQIEGITVVRKGGSRIVAETKKFDQPMLVPADNDYEIILTQAGGQSTTSGTSIRGKLVEVSF